MIGFFIILILVITGYYILNPVKPKVNKNVPELILDEELLNDNIAFYRKLNDEDKVRFKQEIKDFVSYVTITGVGTEVTNLQRIMVASSAVIPVFAFPGSRYPNLEEVLLYPDSFNMEFETSGNNSRDIAGMVGTGFMNGKMILSKHALEEGFSNKTDKRNTAIHEFVHLVDKSDGDIDGIPEHLLDKQYVLPWLDLVHKEMMKIKEGDSDIDAYGYTNKSEFFAVAAEYFFERPDILKNKHPELFAMMQRIFIPQNK